MGVEGYDIVTLDEALDIADNMGMDLVAMNDNEVPVCKIMDYQKFQYEQRKRAKQSKANKAELKEVKFNPVIADYDMSIKAKTASRILSEGDKVKVTITYKGRMMQFIKTGVEKMESFESMIEYPHNIDRKPMIEGNRVYMIISPAK